MTAISSSKTSASTEAIWTEMQEFSLRALVIRENDIGEQDKLLTLLCAEKGRLTARCRGSKNIKSKKLAATLFCYGDFTFTESKGMLSVKEIQMLENFYPLREDLGRLSLAGYVAEVLQKVTTEENPEEELMTLGLNTLYTLSYNNKPLPLVKSVFELRCLYHLGFTPDLSGCAQCQKKQIFPYYLDLTEGTLLCHDCRMLIEGDSSLLSLGETTLAAMRYIISSAPKRIFSFTLPDESLQELSGICERFFIEKTETNFKTLKFYHSTQQ